MAVADDESEGLSVRLKCAPDFLIWSFRLCVPILYLCAFHNDGEGDEDEASRNEHH